MPILGQLSSAARATGFTRATGPAGAFEAIASVVSTGSSTSVVFSSIPQTYASLQIRGHMLGSSAVNTTPITARINDIENPKSYAWRRINGNGSVVVASASTGHDAMRIADSWGQATASETSAFILNLHDYANTSRIKTFRTFSGRDSNGAGMVALLSGAWHGDTQAITSITLFAGGATIPSGSVFSLYGIRGAS